LFMRLMSPFIRVVHGTAQTVIGLLGFSGADHRAVVHSEEELKMLVTASQEAGVLEEQEEQMLHRVFGFADLTAAQIMVPRTEIIAVSVDATRDEVVAAVARYGHGRLPGYRGDLAHGIGILLATDLLTAVSNPSSEINVAALARELLTVPKTLGADHVLAEMQRRAAREALVIDEYGGTAGLVTFESLVTRIIGDVGPGIASSARTETLRD